MQARLSMRLCNILTYYAMGTKVYVGVLCVRAVMQTSSSIVGGTRVSVCFVVTLTLWCQRMSQWRRIPNYLAGLHA